MYLSVILNTIAVLLMLFAIIWKVNQCAAGMHREILRRERIGQQPLRMPSRARVFILVFSKNSNVSKHVLREIYLATNAGCAVIPFRIDESKLGKGLEYYLGVVHWLDAITPPLEKNIHKLERLIAKILSSEEENPDEPPSPQKTEWWSKVKNKIFVRRSRKSKIAAWVSLGLVCAVLLFDMLWLDPIYAPDFPDIPLSRVDDEYMYLSSGEALITDDLKEAILYDGEKDRYLL